MLLVVGTVETLVWPVWLAALAVVDETSGPVVSVLQGKALPVVLEMMFTVAVELVNLATPTVPALVVTGCLRQLPALLLLAVVVVRLAWVSLVTVAVVLAVSLERLTLVAVAELA
jgi:hypothetical protein